MPCKREVAPRRRCMDITSLDGVRGSVSYKKLSLETEGEETITGFGGYGADGFSHRAASNGKTTMSDKEKGEKVAAVFLLSSTSIKMKEYSY